MGETLAEQVVRLQDAVGERNMKLVYVCGWLRGIADLLPETSAASTRRLARECRELGTAALSDRPAPLPTADLVFSWIDRARTALQVELNLLLDMHCNKGPDGKPVRATCDADALPSVLRLEALIAEAPIHG
jgi:hypothetical protein